MELSEITTNNIPPAPRVRIYLTVNGGAKVYHLAGG